MAKKDKSKQGTKQAAQSAPATSNGKSAAANKQSEAKQSETKQTTAAKNSAGNRNRNIAIATGVAIAIILALLAFAFFIASLASGNNGNNGNQSSTSSTSSGANSSAQSSQSSGATSSASSSQSSNNGNNGQNGQGSEGNGNNGNGSANTQEAGKVDHNFTYRAGKGDSVSTLARRAIRDYLRKTGVQLDPAKRLYWEVQLTNSSNPQWLEIGEARTFSASTMNSLFNQARDLSGAQHFNWARQARSVHYV